MRVWERTIAGESPGAVIRCVLEVERLDHTFQTVERVFGDAGPNVASFARFTADLHAALRDRHGSSGEDAATLRNHSARSPHRVGFGMPSWLHCQ